MEATCVNLNCCKFQEIVDELLSTAQFRPLQIEELSNFTDRNSQPQQKKELLCREQFINNLFLLFLTYSYF